MAKKLAGYSVSSVIGWPFWFTTPAVVMITDLIAAGDQSGWELFSKAAMPRHSGEGMTLRYLTSH